MARGSRFGEAPRSRELVFIKLGGSLITDKTGNEIARPDVIRRLAAEIAAVRATHPELQVLLAHGSGSFGHTAGKRHGTRDGVSSPSQWRGFAETASAALRLNCIVTACCWEAHLPVWSIQPSASSRCEDGQIVAMNDQPIRVGLGQGLVPVVYGDVALDRVRGGTIVSTEEILVWLARRLRPHRILLLGTVPGVTCISSLPSGERDLVSHIAPESLSPLLPMLGPSHGTDVTGGMLAKVQTMCALVKEQPEVEVHVLSGEVPGLLADVLADRSLHVGTVISAYPRACDCHGEG